MPASRIIYTCSTCADDLLQLSYGMFERLLHTSSSQIKSDYAAVRTFMDTTASVVLGLLVHILVDLPAEFGRGEMVEINELYFF